jgi:RNA polymerase subunit RPABC4/transcription elongation factor Spt4
MADLAAQEPAGKNGVAVCERCFAPLAPGEAYCPECGAPTGESVPAADSAVHGELAAANLLRLRGDLDGSEKALLGILRRFPNDPYAHEMLGDVCAERGETERAKEWYELALDLAPTSTDIRRKLEDADGAVEEQVTADTAETLGLPPTTPPAVWWPLAAATAILLLAVGVAAWPRKPAPPPIHASVSAPTTEPTNPAVASTDPTPTPATTPQTTPAGSDEDRRLLTEIQSRPDGSHVQSVVLDPRTQAVTLTYEIAESEDPKALAVSLGRETLDAASAATLVTLRAIRGGSIVFTADMMRTAMNDPEPLSNVWPTPTAGSQPAPGTTLPPTSTSTATTGTTTGSTPSNPTTAATAGTGTTNP